MNPIRNSLLNLLEEVDTFRARVIDGSLNKQAAEMHIEKACDRHMYDVQMVMDRDVLAEVEPVEVFAPSAQLPLTWGLR